MHRGINHSSIRPVLFSEAGQIAGSEPDSRDCDGSAIVGHRIDTAPLLFTNATRGARTARRTCGSGTERSQTKAAKK
ncbi:hypothetical protein CDO25_11010 [Sinorhizobium meliloti]|nr:hypothetical protein CDO25_11010 [Sinorhizobium meliloti]